MQPGPWSTRVVERGRSAALRTCALGGRDTIAPPRASSLARPQPSAPTTRSTTRRSTASRCASCGRTATPPSASLEWATSSSRSAAAAAALEKQPQRRLEQRDPCSRGREEGVGRRGRRLFRRRAPLAHRELAPRPAWCPAVTCCTRRTSTSRSTTRRCTTPSPPLATSSRARWPPTPTAPRAATALCTLRRRRTRSWPSPRCARRASQGLGTCMRMGRGGVDPPRRAAGACRSGRGVQGATEGRQHTGAAGCFAAGSGGSSWGMRAAAQGGSGACWLSAVAAAQRWSSSGGHADAHGAQGHHRGALSRVAVCAGGAARRGSGTGGAVTSPVRAAPPEPPRRSTA